MKFFLYMFVVLSMVNNFSLDVEAKCGKRCRLKNKAKRGGKTLGRVAAATGTFGLSEVIISREKEKKAKEELLRQAKDAENKRRIEGIRSQIRVHEANIDGSNIQMEILSNSISDIERDIDGIKEYLVDVAPLREAIKASVKTSKEYKVSLFKLSRYLDKETENFSKNMYAYYSLGEDWVNQNIVNFDDKQIIMRQLKNSVEAFSLLNDNAVKKIKRYEKDMTEKDEKNSSFELITSFFMKGIVSAKDREQVLVNRKDRKIAKVKKVTASINSLKEKIKILKKGI